MAKLKVTSRRVLYIAVAFGLVAAFLAWWAVGRATASRAQTVDVVVAKTDIAPRTAVTGDMLEVKKVAASARHPNALSNPQSFVGKTTKQSITAGEQVLTTKFFGQRAESGLAFVIPPGKRAVAVEVTEVIGSGGLIVPGDFVDVIAVRSLDKGGRATVVLQNVEVLAVAQSITGEEATAPSGEGDTTLGTAEPKAEPKAKSVTLAVTTQEAQRLVLYDVLAEDLRLALRGAEDHEIVGAGDIELQ